MTTRRTDYRRLQPQPNDRNPEQGFAAVLYDPAWMLARQWQMGEHQAENASTPVRVNFKVRETPIAPYRGRPELDPQHVPIEPIVEAEPQSWWTMGRRIRVGAALAARIAPTPEVAFTNPPPPYERFAGRLDGRELWRQRAALGLTVADFGTDRPPDDGPDSWDSEELVYQAEFATADAALVMPRHAGGTVDWYSADARALPPDAPPVPPVRETARTAFPAQFEYPGAPNDRWWAIEDAAVDIGGYPPDPHHFPTLLLIDLIVSHGTDWFLFPIATRAGRIVTFTDVQMKNAAGPIVTRPGVEVIDSFGDTYPVTPPDGWSLFQTAGLSNGSLVVWPTAATPLEGLPVEEVAFGIDEFSNYLWAVERRVQGRERPTPPQSGPRATPDTTVRKAYEYMSAAGLLPGWHPYMLRDEMIDGKPQRRFVQGRIIPGLEPGVDLRDPTAAVLGASDNGELLFVHKVQPATIPANGMSVKRNWLLTRDADGNPVLWVQRRREPLLAPPGRQVRFDVFRDSPGAV